MICVALSKERLCYINSRSLLLNNLDMELYDEILCEVPSWWFKQYLLECLCLGESSLHICLIIPLCNKLCIRVEKSHSNPLCQNQLLLLYQDFFSLVWRKKKKTHWWLYKQLKRKQRQILVRIQKNVWICSGNCLHLTLAFRWCLGPQIDLAYQMCSCIWYLYIMSLKLWMKC